MPPVHENCLTYLEEPNSDCVVNKLKVCHIEVIIYRDGVGEGQLAMTVDHELQQFKVSLHQQPSVYSSVGDP
jgi:hypothetical protein